MANKLKPVDANVVLELAKLCCTTEEIARACKVSKDTIERRFMDILNEGRANCRVSLRRKMFQIAMDDQNPKQTVMCIFLSKQILGFMDVVQTTAQDESRNSQAAVEFYRKMVNDPGNARAG